MDRELRIAQIGVGYWGKNLLRNFANHESCHVAWICDRDPSILEWLTHVHPDVQATVNPEEAIQATDVDAVVIATDTPNHFLLAKASLQTGKHVFVEKPMTRTVSEARELCQLAETNDLRLMTGHLLMYHPAFLHVRHLIQEGELGDVYYMYSSRVNLGVVRQSENAFESLAPHDISVALDFLDKPPVAVSAQGQAFLQPNVEDVAFATIYFEDDRLAHLHTSWLDPHKSRKVTVVGSRRMAVIDDVASTEKVRVFDKGVDITSRESRFVDYPGAMTLRSGDIHIPKIDMMEPLYLECDHFVDCVLKGLTPRSDGRNGLAVVNILEAARQSMLQGGARIQISSP